MKSHYAVEPAEIAEYFVNSRGVLYRPTEATKLVADVQHYLRAHRMDHRLPESIEIASEAFKILREVEAQSVPAPSEVEAAWQGDLQEGIGARRPELDMATYASQRGRLGMQQSTLDFLAGTGQ